MSFMDADPAPSAVLENITLLGSLLVSVISKPAAGAASFSATLAITSRLSPTVTLGGVRPVVPNMVGAARIATAKIDVHCELRMITSTLRIVCRGRGQKLAAHIRVIPSGTRRVLAGVCRRAALEYSLAECDGQAIVTRSEERGRVRRPGHRNPVRRKRTSR